MNENLNQNQNINAEGYQWRNACGSSVIYRPTGAIGCVLRRDYPSRCLWVSWIDGGAEWILDSTVFPVTAADVDGFTSPDPLPEPLTANAALSIKLACLADALDRGEETHMDLIRAAQAILISCGNFEWHCGRRHLAGRLFDQARAVDTCAAAVTATAAYSSADITMSTPARLSSVIFP